MPLAEASMAAAWSTKVHMYDASPSGYGVVSSEFDASLVSSVGRVKERHRFAKHFTAARTAMDFVRRPCFRSSATWEMNLILQQALGTFPKFRQKSYKQSGSTFIRGLGDIAQRTFIRVSVR